MSDPDRLAERHPGSQPEMAAEAARTVLSTMSGDLSAQETSLLAEVEMLGRIIACAKAEIAALRVDDINDHHIPSATDELDAIVEHTAAATDAILTSCETLDDVAGSLTGEPATKLQDATTRIYEACSFQDITGQRITKVVAALKAIEAKVADITATFARGGNLLGGAAPETPQASEPILPVPDAWRRSGDELLNGPQLPENAMAQSDIDRLLASSD